MKTLFAIAMLCFAVSASAQTSTNIDYRVIVETVSGGATNKVTTNFRYDASNKKDGLKIDGLALAFAQYAAAGGAQDFGGWLKIDTGDRAKAYADAKQASDNAALLAKLTSLLTTNPDLLSNADITSLNTIAAKAP
jgi:hypothetical protein